MISRRSGIISWQLRFERWLYESSIQLPVKTVRSRDDDDVHTTSIRLPLFVLRVVEASRFQIFEMWSIHDHCHT